MHVEFYCTGGPLDGHQKFEDNHDILPQARRAEDATLAIVLMFYHLTAGEIGRSLSDFSPAVFEQAIRGKLPDELHSVGHTYQIISRHEEPDLNTVQIVAEYVPTR